MENPTQKMMDQIQSIATFANFGQKSTTFFIETRLSRSIASARPILTWLLLSIQIHIFNSRQLIIFTVMLSSKCSSFWNKSFQIQYHTKFLCEQIFMLLLRKNVCFMLENVLFFSEILVSRARFSKKFKILISFFSFFRALLFKFFLRFFFQF